jgi:hypothetical protein
LVLEKQFPFFILAETFIRFILREITGEDFYQKTAQTD